MGSLCDAIEEYIKDMLRSTEGTVEIQRNSLAGQLGCVPSQINYVLDTRFSVERGYFIESRRGGGGYIRIVRREFGPEKDIVDFVCSKIPVAISRPKAEDYVRLLEEEDLVSPREAALLMEGIGDGIAMISREHRDAVRSHILRCMLVSLARAQVAGDGGGV